ncbi:MAG: ANTAR domain-containing response regulator [Clostridia bacterium]
MKSVILAFQNPDAANTIQRVVQLGGYGVSGICSGGAEVLRMLEWTSASAVICGYRLKDTTAAELFQNLPQGIGMLVLLSQNQADNVDMPYGIQSLNLPVSRTELLDTLKTVIMINDRPSTKKSGEDTRPGRSEEDKKTIVLAKELLMEHSNMTEDQAHRFIQRVSMNNGSKMIDTARAILAGDIVY